jgi:flavin-binding protein dodecin
MSESVYRVIEVIGTSSRSWEEAARTAVSTASSTLRDLRVAEVTQQDVVIGDDGQVALFRVRLNLSFKYEAD